MHRARLLLPVLLLVLALAACGGSERKTETAADDAPAGAFPVTIRSQLGTAEVAEAPQRVVALDFDSADAAIALGVAPVGMAEVDFAPGKVQPWTSAALGDARPQLFAYTDGPPLETIAALRPDLILATNTYGLKAHWSKLSRIAPVIVTEGDEGTDSWETSTRRIGEALGRARQAERLIDETNAAVADARQAHPAFDAKTVTFFNLYEGDAWVITKADASVKFLQQLGFVPSPQVARLRGAQGRAQVAPERFSQLDADVVVGTAVSGDVTEQLADAPTFQRLDAVGRDAFVGLDLVTATSIAFPSALSVQWGVEQIVPKLAAATG